MTEFSLPLRVYIEDTDAGGIVYYVNYLKYMERSRTEFLRSLGYHKVAILDGGLLLVVHSVQINYRKSARLDDQLTATTSVAKLAKTYVEFKQTIFRDDDILCDGNVCVACVDAKTMKPNPLPLNMHNQIEEFFLTQTAAS